MSNNVHIDGSTRIGTIGGAMLVTLLNIRHNDFIRIIGFAALGATVSFFVSLFWKWMVKRAAARRIKKGRPSSGDPG